MAISRAEIEGRQERLRAALREAGLPGAVVVGRGFFDRPGSLAYLTGHIPPFISAPFSDETGGAGLAVAVFPADGAPVLIDMFPTRPDLTAVSDIRASAQPVADTIAALREKGLGAGPLAVVDGDLLPWAFARVLGDKLPDLQLVPFDEPVLRMRQIKSAAEVELIRHAAAVADAGLRAAREACVPGVTEQAVGAAGHAAALAAGADFVRYLRVHSGPWTFTGARWPQATDRVVEAGDYVTLDIIGTAQGYGFDVLRCFTAGPEVPAQTRLTQAAAAVTSAIVAACVPGATGRDLYAAGRRKAEELGYLDALDTFIGHGIGLETMEWPELSHTGETPLEPGMVLCIEPGLRVDGLAAARIEEMVHVTADRPELLTVTPLEL